MHVVRTYVRMYDCMYVIWMKELNQCQIHRCNVRKSLFLHHSSQNLDNLCDVLEGLCLNGGTCVEQGEPTDRNVACECLPEYTGLICEGNIKEVASHVNKTKII